MIFMGKILLNTFKQICDICINGILGSFVGLMLCHSHKFYYLVDCDNDLVIFKSLINLIEVYEFLLLR